MNYSIELLCTLQELYLRIIIIPHNILKTGPKTLKLLVLLLLSSIKSIKGLRLRSYTEVMDYLLTDDKHT